MARALGPMTQPLPPSPITPMTQFGSAARSAGFTRSLAALPAPPPKSGPAVSPFRSTPATPLASPVPSTISTSTNVFVGDYGGFLYRVSSTAAVTKSAQIDFGAGLVAGPVVDSTAGKVYVFSSSDGSTSCTGFIPCSAVYLFATNFGSGTSGTEARVGSSQVAPPNPNPLFEGSFDSTYRASVNATGNLYVCGNTGGKPDHVSGSNYCRRNGHCRCRTGLGQCHDRLLSRDRHSQPKRHSAERPNGSTPACKRPDWGTAARPADAS